MLYANRKEVEGLKSAFVSQNNKLAIAILQLQSRIEKLEKEKNNGQQIEGEVSGTTASREA